MCAGKVVNGSVILEQSTQYVTGKYIVGKHFIVIVRIHNGKVKYAW